MGWEKGVGKGRNYGMFMGGGERGWRGQAGRFLDLWRCVEVWFG